MDEYHQYAGVARTIGVQVNFLSPAEVKERWPLCATDGLVGAIVHPEDGYIQPADLTQALAAGARARGAEIHRNTTVTAIEAKNNGEWRVRTDRGDITCEHVVSATGSFARRTGAMVGLDVPVIPVQHQYIVTEPHPDIEARHARGLPEMGVLRESDGSWYMREERGGLVLGPYELGAPACYVDGPAEDCEYELFPEDLERLEPHIESAIRRVPAFGEVGVKQVYNGAICYTPDGSPIIGPAWGLRNFWLNEGHSFGITAAGGAPVSSWRSGSWKANPRSTCWGWTPAASATTRPDPTWWRRTRRPTATSSPSTTPTRNVPRAGRFAPHPATSARKRRARYSARSSAGSAPTGSPPPGTPREDHWSFRRSRWFEHSGNEVRNAAENAGLLDMSAFAKCRVSGPGAEAFLDRLVANRIPSRSGPVRLVHALNTRGGVHSEFTVYREVEDSFYLVSAGAFQRLDHDWIRRHMPRDGSVRFENITNRIGVLVVAGPRSREILSRVSSASFSTPDFPWLSGREIDVGLAPCLALRVNYVGELGWELHHPIEYQNHIFDALTEAGRDLGIGPLGIRAMDTMRLEKSYRMVGTELSIEYAAFESGLDRFVHLNKSDFIGRDALTRWRERGFANRLVTLEVHGVVDADALGNNPIFNDEELVGRATGGGFGFRVEKSLALGMLRPELAEIGASLRMDILGTMHERDGDPGVSLRSLQREAARLKAGAEANARMRRDERETRTH